MLLKLILSDEQNLEEKIKDDDKKVRDTSNLLRPKTSADYQKQIAM